MCFKCQLQRRGIAHFPFQGIVRSTPAEFDMKFYPLMDFFLPDALILSAGETAGQTT